MSGPHGGDAGQPFVGRARQKWSVIRVARTRGGFRRPLATPLLRHQEFTLHPLEALRLRIAFVFKATGEHRGCFRRWSDPERAKSFAPPRAARRARLATTIQFETELIPIASAARHTTIAQATKSCVLLFSENMRPV